MNGITLIKVGGNEVDDREWVARLAAALAARKDGVVIVHGGGKEVSELQRALGAEPEWRDGLRVTTPEALRAVSMVLSGVVNKRLVSALVSAGVDAAGISGEDAALIGAVPAREGALGRTGEVAKIDPRILLALIAQGFVPVVSPVSRGPEGEALNVNADDAAAALATALRARSFLLVSNIPGVLRDGERLEEVSVAGVEELIGSGVASGGMAPKLRAAARAAAAGVAEVRIGGLELLDGAGPGTRIAG